MKNQEYREYQRHVAALIMAQLVHKSAAGSDMSSDLQLWDRAGKLCDMAEECSAILADRFFERENES